MPHTTSLSEFPPAYLITFHTYGTWLHGENKGSVDREHNHLESDLVPANKQRVEAMQQKMSGEAMLLDQLQRSCVDQAIVGVCEHRNWDILAMHVRTNHVHVVVAATAKPEKVMNDFKSWATRKLREAALCNKDHKIWSRHGSTRYLRDDEAVQKACHYVIEGQGVEL